MNPSWMAVHTQKQRESLAELNLKRQGYEVYLPRFEKTRRHARKIDTVSAPLFPRYLFVRNTQKAPQWRPINGTLGVCYLISYEGKPALIDEQLIEDLRQKHDQKGHLPLSTLNLFTKGKKVEINTGSFKDYLAEFERFTDRDRVEVLLEFLGRKIAVKVPLQAVRAV